MNTFLYKTTYFETDYWSLIPTGHLLRLAMHAIMLKTNAEGLRPERLRDGLGAIWMLARARFYQDKPLYGEGEIALRVSGRSIDHGTYARAVDFMVSGERAARCELASILVNPAERRIIRPRVLEEFWGNEIEPENNVRVLRLVIRDELTKLRDYTVSYRDCDYNGHFNSSSYIDLVSELAGYYEGEAKLIKYLQIDYSAEALPGQTLVLRGRTDGLSGAIRGEHESGSVCFSAEYELEMAKN